MLVSMPHLGEAAFQPPAVRPLRVSPPADGRPPDWTGRLLTRRYHFPPAGDTDKDLAVRIDHGGISCWFPLKTPDPDLAARKAGRIHDVILRQGWSVACRRFSRELIISFEWCSNPILWTYTTIHTVVAPQAAGAAPAAGPSAPRPVVILEADAGIRRALQWCVGQQPQFSVLGCSSPARFLQLSAGRQPALVLLNHRLAERVGVDLSAGVTALKPGVTALGYSVSADGDQMFASTPGGASGYLLKRVPPAGILEPFVPAGRELNGGRANLLETVRSSFKEILWPRTGVAGATPPRLTPRETDVLALLSKGCADKEIADALGLSVWTVHGHIKKIFERLRVRTRTEAVVRYLEK